MALQSGERAPDFSVPDETGKTRTLREFAGKHVVLWFFPKADTPGWTAEGSGFRDRIREFEEQRAVILGASFDTEAENRAFREKFSFPFPLLCDTKRELGLAYGACDDAKAANARRAAVWIDPQGKVKKHWAKVDAKAFPQQVLDELAAAPRG